MHGMIGVSRLSPVSTPASIASCQEELGVAAQRCERLGLGLHLAQRGQRRRGVRRGHPGAEDEPGRRVLQVLDQRLAAGDVAAAAGQRLRQRARPELDVAAVDAEVLADAAAAGAEHPDAVRLVDHQQRAVALLDLDDAPAGRRCRRPGCRRPRSRSAPAGTDAGWRRRISSSAAASLCGKGRRVAPDSSPPCTMLLWASASWITRSPGPTRCPITVTLVACPLTQRDRVVGAEQRRQLRLELLVDRLLARRAAGSTSTSCRSGRRRPGRPR